MAHQSGGHGLVSSNREARRDGRADRIAGGRGQLGLEHRVAKGRASHRGIGARDSPESRAGGGSAVHHGGEKLFVGSWVSSRAGIKSLGYGEVVGSAYPIGLYKDWRGDWGVEMRVLPGKRLENEVG